MRFRQKNQQKEDKENRASLCCDDFRKKIQSEQGESLGEALAAMLVVALGALMLQTMTSAATKIVSKSEDSYHQFLQSKNDIESRKALEAKGGIDKLPGGTVTLSQVGSGYTLEEGAHENVKVLRVSDNNGNTFTIYYPYSKAGK